MMKKAKTKILLTLALGATLAFSGAALASCSNPLTDVIVFGKPAASKPQVSTILNFVAVSGSEWDTSLTMDKKAYTISLELMDDNTLTLVGTCTGKAQSSSGQGGGMGGPGGGMGGGSQTQEPEEDEDDSDVDYSQFNFTIEGTWEEEAGWGYTLNLKDSKNSKIYVNYDEISGRQYFYYAVNATVDGKTVTASQSKFEAKDSNYRKKLAVNYVTHEERVCTYMFRGGQEGGSGNLKSAWLYLMPDSTVVSISGTSNSLTYTADGNWTEDKTKHVITVTTGGSTYTSDAYCDEAGKEGYRLTYSAMTLYASCNTASYTWDKYTSVDFEGETVYTMNGLGEFVEYTLELTKKGYANVKQGDTVKYTARYTQEDGEFVIGDYKSQTENGVTKLHLKWIVVTSNCCGTTETPYEGDFQMNR